MAATLDDVSWPVNTARLSLRRATVGDVDAIWAIRRLPEVTEWLSSAPTDRDAFVSAWIESGRVDRVIVIERDGDVIGDLLIRIEDGWAQREVAEQAEGVQAELGWVLDPSQSGCGYATEAVAAALDICFDQLGMRRVIAGCFADNVASWRLMERLGMRREAHTRSESLHRSGRWLDGYGYAILADEWRRRVDQAPAVP